MSVKKRASIQDVHGALKASLVRVYKTMGDYRRCKASVRKTRCDSGLESFEEEKDGAQVLITTHVCDSVP